MNESARAAKREYNRLYRKRNLEKVREYHRNYQRKWRAENPEKAKQYVEDYWMRKAMKELNGSG